MAPRTRFGRALQDGEKLSFVAAAQKMMQAHIASADFEALKTLDGYDVDEFMATSGVGRAMIAAPEWSRIHAEAQAKQWSWEGLCRKAHVYSKSIFENFGLLGGILDRHEATIHRRWLKKSNKLRLAVVREAWGVKMAPSHRPDFEALELESESKRLDGTDYRDYYLLPYINEEDLCKSRSLLLLMSTRGRYHPSELAISEYEAHRIGRSAYIFSYTSRCKEFDEYCMDLKSRGGADSYGRLWSISSHPDQCESLWQQEFQDPEHGILVLEAQERVLSFLVRCAKLILHDFTEETILQGPILPFQIPPKPDSVHNSLATIAAEAPYQKPDSLDFSRIAALLTAKRDAAADHLWSLREDPSYFEAQMLEVREHRRELVPDCYGQQHPICSPGHEDEFWARIVHQEITCAFHHVEIFSELQSQAVGLGDMQKSYAEELRTSSAFPDPYTKALLTFRHYLISVASTFSTELGLGFCASPPMRSYHRRPSEKDPTSEVLGVLRNPDLKFDAVRARLNWLVAMLWDKDERFQMIGPTFIVDELQRLIDTKSARSLLSTYVASTVGDLSIVFECINQVELYQPWAQKHGSQTNKERDDMLNEMKAYVKIWQDSANAIDKKDSTLGSLGRPTDGKFAYPVAKRRTRENVELMRQAERNLDKFWEKVDQDIKSKCGSLADGAVLFTQDRTLQRTPEWTQPIHESTKPAVEELYVPLSQLFFNEQTRSKEAVLEKPAQQPREKIKTRKPGNSETTAGENQADIPTSQAQTVPLFAVNSRALKVFKTLFFTHSLTSTPGEVAWMDFLHAMVAVGFVPEKLYGSVWQFSPDPDKLAVERGIQFHEPHGANTKILYRIARRHGRRLNRAYGWDGSSFTLEEKSKE